MRKTLLTVTVLLCAGSIAMPTRAEDRSAPAAASAPAPAAAAPRLFAIEIRVGPEWDAAKPPGEQAFFREHSANLRRLRDAGNLVLGARYGEVGLVVLSATSLEDARAMMDADPAMQAGVFAYEAHAFNVFYSGTVDTPPRSP
jgi:uncharacterized protein YciI